MIRTILSNHYKLIIPAIVLFASVFFQDNLHYYYSKYIKAQNSNNDREDLFTAETLARYNGITEKKLYMAIVGIVYDVSEGKQHYAKGSPYHYFVGKDGSRALITGDFKDESENKDHVLDLPCNDFLALLQWKKSLETKYKVIGILAGRYYERDGRSTSYTIEFLKKTNLCLEEKELGRKHDAEYPPCNIAWSESEGTKVWCTKTSGGLYRDWVGVPRQLYTPGEQRPRCVCINTDHEQEASMKFREYENCANTSVVCFVDSGDCVIVWSTQTCGCTVFVNNKYIGTSSTIKIPQFCFKYKKIITKSK